ncbi:MAG: 50S ribosomal protein L11 methyltransferase, partial [Hyphomicrobiales bacterium]
DAAFEENGYAMSHFEVEPDNPDSQEWTIDIYVPKDELEEVLSQVKDYLPSDMAGLEITHEDLGDEDWVAMSLEGLRPVSAGRFFVHGAHDKALIPAGSVSVEIEAGQAFGTGHHGTTAGCLEALEDVLRRRSYQRIFDLGTGTGLLAIALAKACHQTVLASDIDPVSVQVARENAQLNRVANWLHVVEANGMHHAAIRENAPFDLVVANILAGPLIVMSGQIAGQLAAGGSLILSGILDAQANRVVAAYVAHGLCVERRASREGWTTLTFKAEL